MDHSKAKERALRHRTNVGKFFKKIGSGIATGAKKVNDNVLTPVGTYVKNRAIGERAMRDGRRKLTEERLNRLGIDPESVLYKHLMKEAENAPTETRIIIVGRITPDA